MHGVFRGYQTLLALYSFMKLAARLRALRAGRPVTSLEDVREGVRLVERAFVLRARYTDLFALEPHGRRDGRPPVPATVLRPARHRLGGGIAREASRPTPCRWGALEVAAMPARSARPGESRGARAVSVRFERPQCLPGGPEVSGPCRRSMGGGPHKLTWLANRTA